LFLPPILFAPATSRRSATFKANLRAILLLAVGLVLFTMVRRGGVTKALVPSCRWRRP
jgi:NhaP-type Na+/H+ or K+/H+ antiporter